VGRVVDLLTVLLGAMLRRKASGMNGNNIMQQPVFGPRETARILRFGSGFVASDSGKLVRRPG